MNTYDSRCLDMQRYVNGRRYRDILNVNVGSFVLLPRYRSHYWVTLPITFGPVVPCFKRPRFYTVWEHVLWNGNARMHVPCRLAAACPSRYSRAMLVRGIPGREHWSSTLLIQHNNTLCKVPYEQLFFFLLCFTTNTLERFNIFQHRADRSSLERSWELPIQKT